MYTRSDCYNILYCQFNFSQKIYLPSVWFQEPNPSMHTGSVGPISISCANLNSLCARLNHSWTDVLEKSTRPHPVKSPVYHWSVIETRIFFGTNREYMVRRERKSEKKSSRKCVYTHNSYMRARGNKKDEYCKTNELTRIYFVYPDISVAGR